MGRPRAGWRQQSGARTAAGHGVCASQKKRSHGILEKPFVMLEEVPIIALEASAGAFAALRKDGMSPRRFRKLQSKLARALISSSSGQVVTWGGAAFGGDSSTVLR